MFCRDRVWGAHRAREAVEGEVQETEVQEEAQLRRDRPRDHVVEER